MCTDKNLLKRKKNLFIFNNNKYENLSQRTDYEVPRLKILGRIETEFKFMSIYYIYIIYKYVYVYTECHC